MPLAAPSNLNLTPISTTRIDLAWTNGDVYYQGIWIYRRLPGGSWSQIDIVDYPAESYHDTSCAEGTRYYYRVRGKSDNEFSGFSNEPDAATFLDEPTGLSATAVNCSTINLAWTNQGTYSTIKIERKKGASGTWEQVHERTGSYESWQNTGLDIGSTYYYRIRGYRGSPDYSYSAYSAEAHDTTPSISAPTNVHQGDPAYNYVELLWTNSESPDYVEIQRRLSGETDWNAIANFSWSGQSSYTDQNNIKEGYTYHYKIRYKIAGNWGPFSNSFQANTILRPPYNLKATFLSPNPTNPLLMRIQLTWSNHVSYATKLYLERRKDLTGSWESLDDWGLHIAGNQTSAIDVWAEAGHTFEYRIYGYIDSPHYCTSDYSNEATYFIGLQPPSNLQASCLSPTSVRLTWQDNSVEEYGFDIYRDGVSIHQTGPNATEWIDTTVSASTWYTYKVASFTTTVSPFSNEVRIYTSYPPNAPSNLIAYSVSTSQINLDWQDNELYENDYHIEESLNGIDFSEIATVGQNVTHYERTGLGSDQLRYYRIRGHNSAGYSDYSNIASARTLAAIAQATNLQAFPFSDTKIEITFKDNSSAEEGHSLERKPDGGEYAEVVFLPKNVEYYRDSGLVKNSKYWYRVRPKQGAQWGDYSEEVSATTMNDPVAPTGLEITEHTDTKMRLSWTAAAAAAGYKIEKSTDGSNFNEIAKIDGSITQYLARSLSLGTQYWFRVRAYTIVGNSSYCGPVNDTTDEEYIQTAFDILMRNPNVRLVFPVEIRTKMRLLGFSPSDGMTYTYELAIPDRGIDFESLCENGEIYEKKNSAEEVEAIASSFWFDFHNRILYLHTSAGNDPINYFIEGSFWLYFTNYQDGNVTFNDKYYFPFFRAESIPDISQAINPYYEGNFAISSGTITFFNPLVGKSHFFDRLFERYVWKNSLVRVKVGRPGFSYSQFKNFFSALIDSFEMTDRTMVLNLTDSRESINVDLPLNKLWRKNYPMMAANLEATYIPTLYGPVTNGLMHCVDEVNRKKFVFHDGPVHSSSAVKKNDEALVENTDYWVNLRDAIVVFSDAMTITEQDKMTIDFEGRTNIADELISNGADIYYRILKDLLGLAVDDINVDSIQAAKESQSRTLCVYLYSCKSSGDVIRNIEHSVEAFSFQDADGKIGLRASEDEPESSARYIMSHQVFDFRMAYDPSSVYQKIQVYYDEDPLTQQFLVEERVSNQLFWKYGDKKAFEIFSYLTLQGEAAELASNILVKLDKAYPTFVVPAVLYDCQAGDLFYFSRDRFYNSDGFAANLIMRILEIKKLVSSRRTEIRAEIVP